MERDRRDREMTVAATAGEKPSILLRAERAAALCAAVAMLGMMMVGAVDVIGTAALNSPLPGAFELTEALMVATVFLALALSQREGRQIRVEVLASRLALRTKAVLDLIAELLSALVYAAIAWYGWNVAVESWQIDEISPGLLRFPLWPPKLALALGATLMCAQCLAGSLASLRRAI